jgi:hypothetical protein
MISKERQNKLELLRSKFGDRVISDYNVGELVINDNGALVRYPDYPGMSVQIKYSVHNPSNLCQQDVAAIVGSTLAMVSRTLPGCEKRVRRLPENIQRGIFAVGSFVEFLSFQEVN